MKISEISMSKWFQVLAATSLLGFTSCSVERVDICKTTATSCPGLLNGPQGMTMVDLSPATQSITSIPGSVAATFSEAVAAVEASKFVISGTCANLPTVSGVAMSVDDTIATATLTGGVCLNNQTLIVTVTPASITSAKGDAGTGSALSSTYTMISLGPTASLATPSVTRMTSAGSSTIALTYTGATNTTLTGAGITKNESGVSCNVSVGAVSAAGATLTVSGCTGDGTITVSVNAGTASDASGNLSSASPASAAITIRNTGPSLTSFTPATAQVLATPTTVVATFDEEMNDLVNGDFALTGDCTSMPTVSGVVMSGGGKVATATLTAGTCNDGEQLIVRIVPGNLTDTLGNAGIGGTQTRVYTVKTSGPLAILAVPSAVRINSLGSSTIALTYNGATATTLTSSGITKHESGVSCNVAVTGATAAGATLTVSGCTGTGGIRVSVNANTATDSLGNGSLASAQSQNIAVDNTGPTLSSVTPASGNFGTMPTSIIATFNEAMTTLTTGKFVVSGTCATLPTVTGVAMSSLDRVATATLSAATCAVGETMTVTVDPTTVQDTAGNAGTGSQTAVTYTKIAGSANLGSTSNQNLGDASCSGATGTILVRNNGNANADVSLVDFLHGNFHVDSETCTANPVVPTGTCVVNVSTDTGASGSDTLQVHYFNQNSNTTFSYVLSVTSPGCFLPGNN